MIDSFDEIILALVVLSFILWLLHELTTLIQRQTNSRHLRTLAVLLTMILRCCFTFITRNSTRNESKEPWIPLRVDEQQSVRRLFNRSEMAVLAILCVSFSLSMKISLSHNTRQGFFVSIDRIFPLTAWYWRGCSSTLVLLEGSSIVFFFDALLKKVWSMCQKNNQCTSLYFTIKTGLGISMNSPSFYIVMLGVLSMRHKNNPDRIPHCTLRLKHILYVMR